MSDAKESVRGHCPACGPDRLADVKGKHVKRYDEDHSGVWGITTYRILSCRGCEAPYFQTNYMFSEDMDHRLDENGEWEPFIPETIEHWPPPSKRDYPSWRGTIDVFDTTLGNLFTDVYRCLNAELPITAAIATRTAFDRASELLGIDPAKTFDEKLDDLKNAGKISGDERDTLAILIDAGSAAAHRGWKPRSTELDTLISIIEAFFHRAFVLGEEAKALKARVPAKPKRVSTKKKAAAKYSAQ